MTSENAEHCSGALYKAEISHDAVCAMLVSHSDIEQVSLSTREGILVMYYSKGRVLGLYYCKNSVQVAGGHCCNKIKV